jgi:hypothetical protein
LFCHQSAHAQQSSGTAGILDLEKIEKNGRIAGVRDDLVWFRLNDAVLDDPDVMRYFIALNNCDSRTIIKEMNSEFEYPRLASYYKAKAPEILKNIPLWIGYSSRAFLGEYDRGKKAFPFVDATGKRKTPITLNSFTMLPDRTGLGYTCGVALSAMNGRPTSLLSGGSGPRYAVTVPMTTFTYLAVDEASARQYALKAGPPGGGRSVTFLIEFDILPEKPEITPRARNGFDPQVKFQARIGKITVLDDYAHKPMGTPTP